MSDTGDILGLASFVKDSKGNEVGTHFAAPQWLREMISYCEENPDSGAIIFLDEFNRARRDILNGMFSLALDKTFHTIKLPKNCHIIAAGNPPTDEYYVTDVNETALMARFIHIKMEPSFQEWATYAKEIQMEPTLVSFLQEQPELIEDVKSHFQLPVKVDRRSWSIVDRLFKANTPMNLLEQLMGGVIGMERLVAYKAHLKKSDKPFTAEEVLLGKNLEKIKFWSNPVDVKSSLLSITCDNVFDAFVTIQNFSEQHLDNFTDFLEAVPKEVAYTLLSKLLNKDLKVFKDYTRNNRYEARIVKIVKEAKGIAK
jgi:hypothetical protein